MLAREDIALSPVGNVLINYFALMLKDLYDLSEKFPNEYASQLSSMLEQKEIVPMLIIKVSTPKEEFMSLYDMVKEDMEKKLFKTNEELLKNFMEEYEALGAEYGMTGEEFWVEAESASKQIPDHWIIMRLARSIHMCKYLIEKDKNNPKDD
jgi:hypothetical protein